MTVCGNQHGRLHGLKWSLILLEPLSPNPAAQSHALLCLRLVCTEPAWPCKVNSRGQVVLAPLFLERMVLLTLITSYAIAGSVRKFPGSVNSDTLFQRSPF